MKQTSSPSNNKFSIQVGQLIYTSFVDRGFKMLMTSGTPIEIQQSLFTKIVSVTWDPHNPPDPDYRAAYLYQSFSSPNYTVFGWVYYDGKDEFGRSGIPYFIAYYLLGELDQRKLHVLLNILEKGPISSVDHQLKNENDLIPLIFNNQQNYIPVRPGVTLNRNIYQKSQNLLKDKQLIHWFIPHSNPSHSQPQKSNSIQNIDNTFQSRLQVQLEIDSRDSSMNTANIESILRELVDKTMGIEGAALVSAEGQLIVPAIDLGENTSGIIAGTILLMAQEAKKELNWQTVETVTLRGPDSYIMLNFCKEGIYLLIKSAKVPMGLVEGAVNRGINKLKDELSVSKPTAENTNNVYMSHNPHSFQTDINVISDGQAREDLTDDLPLQNEAGGDQINLDQNITYRGRPATS